MLKTIARHEWRLLRLDPATWILCLLLVAAAGYAAWYGRTVVEAERATLDDFQQKQATELVQAKSRAAELKARLDGGLDVRTLPPQEQIPFASGPMNPFNAQGRAKFGIRPLAPLQALSLGDDLEPPARSMAIDGLIYDFTAGDPTTNPLKLAVGRFDLTVVVLYLLPLVVIGLAHNVLTMERESGILQLLLAQPVGVTTLFVGALLIRALFVAAVLAGLFVITFFAAGIDSSSASLVRFGLWCAAVAGYAAFWFALAVFVGSRRGNSLRNVSILCMCWLCAAVLFPRVIQFVVVSAHPAPSKAEFIQALRSARDLVTTDIPTETLVEEFFQKNPVFRRGTTEAERAQREKSAYYMSRYDRIYREMEPLLETTRAQLNKQDRLFGILRFLTPAAATERLIYDVTGAGPERNLQFEEGIERVRRERQLFYWPLELDDAKITPEVYDRIPRYTFAEQSLSIVFKKAVAPLLAMLIVSAGLILAAIRRSKGQGFLSA
jgi:ABC-2 type transport system permease protein